MFNGHISAREPSMHVVNVCSSVLRRAERLLFLFLNRSITAETVEYCVLKWPHCFTLEGSIYQLPVVGWWRWPCFTDWQTGKMSKWGVFGFSAWLYCGLNTVIINVELHNVFARKHLCSIFLLITSLSCYFSYYFNVFWMLPLSAYHQKSSYCSCMFNFLVGFINSI